MTTPSLAPAGLRSLALLASLAALALGGCKQDVGERCEQGSDCASGYCDYSPGISMTSAAGLMCTAGPNPGTLGDGSAAGDDGAVVETGDGAATEVGDAKSDGGGEAGVDAGDAKSDAGAAETGDAATGGDGAEAGASDAGVETSSDDGGVDGLEAGTNG